jgi:hypothetical protein
VVQKENNYDQAVHKIMNKIRRPEEKRVEQAATENPIKLEQVEVVQAESVDEQLTKEKKPKKSKSEKERKHSKKSSKSEKSESSSKQEKRSSGSLPTISEDNQLEIEIDVKNDLNESGLVEAVNPDREMKKSKKHKKSDKTEESEFKEESLDKQKKHKKSKKHKKEKKASSKDKEKDKDKDKEVLIEQNLPQVAAY